jgi:hypothetical protein
MSDAILQTVLLGMHWPTSTSLFCAHHHDAYPEGDEAMARRSLAGWEIGADFCRVDG